MEIPTVDELKKKDPADLTPDEREKLFWYYVRLAADKYRVRLDVRPLIVAVPDDEEK